MKRYDHGGDVYSGNVRIDFSVNTNPLGVSERVKKALWDNMRNFGAYPDIECRDLRRAIAGRENVSEDNIICSNGAAEMIYAAVRAVMPKKALLPAPSFSEYERALGSVNCEIKYYDLKEENSFRIESDFPDSLHDIDMAFVCNPNNPTGSIADRDIIEAAVEKCRKNGIVFVTDECFADLAGAYSMKGKTPVIKAFTKTYALAGLRLGYMIGESDFLDNIKSQLPPWNVSSAAQTAGVAALEDSAYLERSVKLIEKERAFLTCSLGKLGFKVFKSDANFILIKGGEGVKEKLQKRGILIRNCDNFRNLDGHFYRIAVKTHAENAELIRELGDTCG